MGLGPTGFIKPVPVPIKTRTCGCGYGFQRVRVRVAQKNPRVARDNPYPSTSTNCLLTSLESKLPILSTFPNALPPITPPYDLDAPLDFAG